MSSKRTRQLILLPALALLALPGCKVAAPEPAPAAVPTPPARPALMSWRVASAHLEDIFADIPNSSIDDFRRETPEAERLLVNASHGEAGLKENNAHVYGEPTAVTSSIMLDRLAPGGRGFFLMQALLTTPIRKAVGVELAASRIEIGRVARKQMLDRGLLAGKQLDLVEGDMAKAGVADATLVYMDSVFFSDELLLTVARNLSRAKGMRKIVMIMKGLPANPWFELEKTERLKMSWSPRFGSDVLFYKRTSAPAG